MDQALVSIIIPFYNEEKFLERAVASALQQTYTTVEIILIDDGSTDYSLKIAEQLASQNAKIILLASAHHSLGKARNIGLAKASGEFIVFLDSDDELEDTAVASLMHKMMEEQSDIVICKFGHYDTSGRFVREEGWTKANSLAAECACGMYEHTIASTVWAKLYKAKIAKNIAFVEGLWFEDRPYLLQYFLLSHKVSFESKALWKIHSRTGSITRRLIEKKRIKDICLIFLEELSLLGLGSSPPQLEKILYRHHLRVLINTALILHVDQSGVDDFKALQKEFLYWLNDYLRKLDEKSFNLGFRDRMDIALLRAPQFVGRTIGDWALFLFKRKKIKFISKIKSG